MADWQFSTSFVHSANTKDFHRIKKSTNNSYIYLQFYISISENLLLIMELSFAKLMYIYRRLVIFKLLNCLIWSIFSWEELNSLLCCPLVSWRIQWRASMYAETPWRALANCRCSRGPKEGQGKCAVCHIRYAYDFGILPVFNGFMRFIYPYPSGLCHCHWGNHMIASVTHKLHFVVFCCVFKKNATKCNLCALFWYVLYVWEMHCQWLLQILIL